MFSWHSLWSCVIKIFHTFYCVHVFHSLFIFSITARNVILLLYDEKLSLIFYTGSHTNLSFAAV
jgi:hypothetical protein